MAFRLFPEGVGFLFTGISSIRVTQVIECIRQRAISFIGIPHMAASISWNSYYYAISSISKNTYLYTGSLAPP